MRSIPAKVEIIIAASSSKVARLKFLIVRKFASMNFCSSFMLVILITVRLVLNSCKEVLQLKLVIN